MERSAILVSHLSKSYRTGFLARGLRPALVDLSLEVQSGEIFGYLGPNGSGKTTTLRLLTGLAFPDSGSATILGHDLKDPGWRSRVGFLPEHPYFYDYLSAVEYLDYVGRLFGQEGPQRRERATRLLERVGLKDAAQVSLRRYSKGMSQRLGIAQALMNDPELVFLDEPMSGLDPFGRRLVCDLILELKAKGRTVFFSTHILSDAEALCDRVALLRSGRLANLGRLDEILNQSISHVEVLLSGGDTTALAALDPSLRQRQWMGERCRIELDEAALAPVLEGALRAGARVLSVQPVRQSLEDFFMKEMAGSTPGTWPLQD